MPNTNEPRWIILPVAGKDYRAFNVSLIESYWPEGDQSYLAMSSGALWRIDLEYPKLDAIIRGKQ